ncbi:DNA gyrase inhibitor YacG [Pseudomaricurvus sp. HS19]|uniref:DNA gyrase inhibitor YacG n=1 Tax=Pseudomaricurvus sp. HS19 TaxID=2692626 RepID=UPI001370B465|nr:DNA gyrase inhibitor YacG [Pseudomaricurvus sp. HS19]MYM64699.1 DNA gyrase inhibitor YacG [Pseudomaricurvus sp. HS19]
MTSKKPLEIQCPCCRKPIEYSEAYPQRPFCSERCKLIDLGEWAEEKHKIAGSSVYDDLLSGDDPSGNGFHH